MVVSIPSDHESVGRERREKGVRAQRNDVGVRVGIAIRIAVFRSLGGWDRTVIVRMVGVIVFRMLVAVAMTNLVRMLHLDGQMGTSHVNERDGDDQQTLEDGSHATLGKIRRMCCRRFTKPGAR